MSGGSFSYLYAQEPYNEHDLRAMAEELRSRGMHDAEEATLALIPGRASKELAALWQAVEWHVSCDWSQAQVARAFVKFEASRASAESAALPCCGGGGGAPQ